MSRGSPCDVRTGGAARASTLHRSPAKPNGSSVPLGFGVVRGLLRFALLGLPFAGAALLVAAEFSTLYDVRVVTTIPAGASYSTGGHHGYAQLVIAAAVVVMAIGAALGGSRPAAVAVLVLGAVSLAIALAIDLPVTDDTGLFGQTYDEARAEAAAGLKLELAGACCILLGGALLLVLRPASLRGRGRRRATKVNGDIEGERA